MKKTYISSAQKRQDEKLLDYSRKFIIIKKVGNEFFKSDNHFVLSQEKVENLSDYNLKESDFENYPSKKSRIVVELKSEN